jgi:hypothetical protein
VREREPEGQCFVRKRSVHKREAGKIPMSLELLLFLETHRPIIVNKKMFLVQIYLNRRVATIRKNETHALSLG